MKSVMYQAGSTDSEGYGRFEYLNDSDKGQQFSLFSTDIDLQKEKILEVLGERHHQVKCFTKEWASRPDDGFAEQVYRQMLLELEKNNLLVVYDKSNAAPSPASERRQKLGKPTLASDYWLRIPS